MSDQEPAPIPQLPAAVLTAIAGQPQVDQASLARAKPCPFSGWWKVAVRFVMDGREQSMAIGTPFIVAEVIRSAIAQRFTVDDAAIRLLWYGGLTWLPSELKLHRLAVAKNPKLRRVLGHAGSTVKMAEGNQQVVATPPGAP